MKSFIYCKKSAMLLSLFNIRYNRLETSYLKGGVTYEFRPKCIAGRIISISRDGC